MEAQESRNPPVPEKWGRSQNLQVGERENERNIFFHTHTPNGGQKQGIPVRLVRKTEIKHLRLILEQQKSLEEEREREINGGTSMEQKRVKVTDIVCLSLNLPVLLCSSIDLSRRKELLLLFQLQNSWAYDYELPS